ncbi:PfkB family carbohydrate kinase [Streptomyces himalayensis]|uniref:Carbohydrate kinase n=1 Tax=Streptomyces himalayensis subsp. himalayensis TaxID=2756131 RepID=A0A7W0DSF5_9ACTN|nr:PfkB family carbohydrate kinase [Streptomyces himalayensis]MBA2950438.1 carbohydrate kinase [Streptomyces himalayensis subsp. himalayensis]
MTAIVIGEALVDLVWRTGAASVSPVPGGSPANVAVGLHRLERTVRLTACWGDDPPGALVREYLHATGVPIDRAESASGRTTLALAYVDEATGAATYDFLASWDPLRLALPPDVTLLHTGSLAIVVEPGAERVRQACHDVRSRPGGAVAVDLNVRPGVQPDRAAYRGAVERIVSTADVVKASDEDLAWLYPDRLPGDAARDLLAMGPHLVVTTYGAKGARGLVAGADVMVAAPPVKVVDTIGAGDAFQAALLAALLQPSEDGTHRVRLPEDHDDLERLLHQAVTAGALACEHAGAHSPTRAQLDAALGIA